MTAFEWNQKYPVGQPVEVVMDDDETRKTKTTSIAYNLSGGRPVIRVHGISGHYALHRVRPTKEER